jgi:enoyl-[acyl-carrier protein] reductase I
VGTWPPALGIFTKLLERGKIEASLRLTSGAKLEFERIYPLDAAFDTLADAPADIRENKRYREVGDFSVQGMAERLRQDFGPQPLDIVVHSLANAPEVRKPLLDTSRRGYLEALSVSAYSNISLVYHLGPMMRADGAFLSLTYMAGERVIPGYGGGMSSAKAALEADTRTLSYEAGRRFGVRVNTISAGPWASRAASAIGFIEQMIAYTTANSPLPRPIDAADVGHAAAFLLSPLARAITGSVVYVDSGYHVMGMAVATTPPPATP